MEASLLAYLNPLKEVKAMIRPFLAKIISLLFEIINKWDKPLAWNVIRKSADEERLAHHAVSIHPPGHSVSA